MTALTAVLLLYEPSGKYPRALPRLMTALDRLDSVDASLIVVDNAREGDWEHQVSHSMLQIGGDNRAWEFSAFDKGLAVCERWKPGTDVVALVTDAFEAYGREYLELIDDGLIRCVTRLEACAGWMDSYSFEECRIGELAYDAWMRSSFLLIPRRLLGLISPLAADLDPDELFGSGPERPFAEGGPLSENLQEMLVEWLTRRPAGTGRLPEQWHSRFDLNAETFPFFQGKVKAILREHLISARLKNSGVACYDIRCLSHLADRGHLESFLDQGGDDELQWLGWRSLLGNGSPDPDLPDIHHYWSNKHLRPKLQRFGFDSPDDFFRHYTEKLCRAWPDRRLHFTSIASGNREFEVELARQLLAKGLVNFELHCTDIDPGTLARLRQLAATAGVAGHLDLSISDFNHRHPAAPCDAVLANQCLSRFVDLEELFGSIRSSLATDGYFLAFDSIGRNGRALWPEALELIDRLWAGLPKRYRHNHQLDRLEMRFQSHEDSREGRTQEILPLLLERFHFELFLGFGNLIDPFIDRSFGHNFDPAVENDRAFIDRVHATDDQALRTGRIKPTHMLAAMTVADTGAHLYDGELTPRFAVRPPG